MTGRVPTPDLAALDDIGYLGIDHVGVAVPDLDAALASYRALGFNLVTTEENVEQGVREALLTVGTGGHVQLLAPLSADSAIARFLHRHGAGIQQLAVTVADVDAASARLRERGIDLLYPDARSGTAGSRINFVHPDAASGVLIELVEHPAR